MPNNQDAVKLMPMDCAPRECQTPVLLKTCYGWVEAWFSKGEWQEHYELGLEYTGSTWVCCDDRFQLEVEEHNNAEGGVKYLDHGCEGWLPLPKIMKGINNE